MLENILKRVFGTKNDRELKRLSVLLKEVNNFESTMMALNDAELKAKTPYFREKLKSGLTLDDILTEAFAVAREASRRTLGMRPFDVQIIGGIVLHEGKIAEMKTGEGKTLAATLPLYLNALEGKGQAPHHNADCPGLRRTFVQFIHEVAPGCAKIVVERPHDGQAPAVFHVPLKVGEQDCLFFNVM